MWLRSSCWMGQFVDRISQLERPAPLLLQSSKSLYMAKRQSQHSLQHRCLLYKVRILWDSRLSRQWLAKSPNTIEKIA